MMPEFTEAHRAELYALLDNICIANVRELRQRVLDGKLDALSLYTEIPDVGPCGCFYGTAAILEFGVQSVAEAEFIMTSLARKWRSNVTEATPLERWLIMTTLHLPFNPNAPQSLDADDIAFIVSEIDAYLEQRGGRG